MFAQAILSIVIIWLLAELLCRILLGKSVRTAVLLAAGVEAAGTLADDGPDGELRKRLVLQADGALAQKLAASRRSTAAGPRPTLPGRCRPWSWAVVPRIPTPPAPSSPR